MDLAAQAAFWRASSAEDLAAARALLDRGHVRHALFFAHLALEKLLKALVTRTTSETPPRIHDLLRLAETAGLALTDEQREFLAVFQKYCLEGRYPDAQPATPTVSEAEQGLIQAQEMLAWLTTQLPGS